MPKANCKSCQHMRCEMIEEFELINKYTNRVTNRYVEKLWYWCAVNYAGIHKFDRNCDFYVLKGTRLDKYIEVNKDMVKFNDLPEETPRVDLGSLPKKANLLAVKEEMRDAVQDERGKHVGGLVITFKFVDGENQDMQFPQKYSKIHGAALKEALDKLDIKDTRDLQKMPLQYELTTFRSGYPRYIPTKAI